MTFGITEYVEKCSNNPCVIFNEILFPQLIDDAAITDLSGILTANPVPWVQ